MQLANWSMVGWDPNGGPEAANGDGSFTVSMNAGGANMEYLWVADGVQGVWLLIRQPQLWWPN